MGALGVLLAAGQVLTLAQAVQTAERNQPQLRQAHAQVAAASARADEARAPLLPQVTGSASYQRTTANFIARPGSLPKGVGTGTSSSSWDGFNYFSFGINANQLLWDFGQTWGRWRAAQATAKGQEATEAQTRLQVLTVVRTSYFAAVAARALVSVAQETLANQERHLAQVEAFVRVGTRPEIDLAQARTDRANAKVQLINAANGYANARAQLDQAMGIERSPGDEYDVAAEAAPPLDGEGQPLQLLLDEAVRARRDLAALEEQIRAQQLAVRAAKGAYGPSLTGSAQLTDAGTDIDNTGWNASAQLTLTWGLFQGLLTVSQVREAEATLAGLQAQRDLTRQQVRLDVEQGRLGVGAATEALAAAGEALENARERLRLAEGRYAAGVGSAIELGDAQLALNAAAGQKVQAEFNLASARAQLGRALGRN